MLLYVHYYGRNISKRSKNMSLSTEMGGDGLSAILGRLGLRAECFLHAEFCGAWAVDTSGQRKVPFHLVEKGTGWLHSGEPDEPVLLGSGDFVVFPHDAPHCISSDPERPPPEIVNRIPDVAEGRLTSLLCGFFTFDNRDAWPLLDSLPAVIVLDLREGGRHRQSYPLVQLMIGELERDEPGKQAALNELAYLLFIQLLRLQIDSGTSQGLLSALADKHVGRALNLLHDRFDRGWTVASLAKAVGVSRTVLSERFSALVGKTPMRYLAEWRMQEASERLRKTDASMGQIAEEVGYGSEMAFRRAFRNVTGVTPGSVRRQSRT